MGREDIDGHICRTVNDNGGGDIPSRTLSEYFRREVLLVAKGQKARPCRPTFEFPTLKATAKYQDGYPLLIASEESLLSVQKRIRLEVARQCVSDRWEEEDLVMERYCDSFECSTRVVSEVTSLLPVCLKVQAKHRDARCWDPVGRRPLGNDTDREQCNHNLPCVQVYTLSG